MAGGSAVAGPQQASDASLLLAAVRGLAAELRPLAVAVRLDSRLAEDLGLDSLALVELRSRVEDTFGIVLPDTVLAGGTAGEWLAPVRARFPSRPTFTRSGRVRVGLSRQCIKKPCRKRALPVQ